MPGIDDPGLRRPRRWAESVRYLDHWRCGAGGADAQQGVELVETVEGERGAHLHPALAAEGDSEPEHEPGYEPRRAASTGLPPVIH